MPTRTLSAMEMILPATVTSCGRGHARHCLGDHCSSEFPRTGAGRRINDRSRSVTVGKEGGNPLPKIVAAVNLVIHVVVLDVGYALVEAAAEFLGGRHRQRGAARHLGQ